MSDTSDGVITLTFPDGRSVRAAADITARDALEKWSPDSAREALAAIFEKTPIDLGRPLRRSGSLTPLAFADRVGRQILQHSAAHLVAKGVTEVVPEALPTDGPPTEEGFHYDFDMRPLTPEDMERVESSMRRSVAEGARFEREELSKEEAERLFARNPHKLRYIQNVPSGEPVSVYRTGSFVDLCRGPHVPDTTWLRGVRILGFGGISAEEGSNGRPLQRVRGIGFPTQQELDQYLRMRKEGEARDHRVLGPKLELFLFTEQAPGFPFWLPKGTIVLRELERFVREHLDAAGYSEVRTPLMFAQSVFETSGHWEHYRADMFLTAIDQRVYGVKPMNCPGSMLLFGSRARSYRELPLRLAEFAPLHRLEASGTIHGLTRAREFVQDDAHVFVTEEQVEAEVRTLLDWVREACTTFRLEWTYELSTHPDRFLGDPAEWERAEATLERILKESGVAFRVSPGEGAFYAPKIDIHLKDSMGRSWQTGTIQLDYQTPRRFRLEYQGADGAMHTPIVIHRTILGSWERFLGVLLEHTAGRLPPWLAPEQVRILPVTDRHAADASGLAEQLRGVGLRVAVSESTETLPKRVRQAELDRVPYIVVLGDQEAQAGTVAVRVHGRKGQETLRRDEFVQRAQERIRTRAFEP